VRLAGNGPRVGHPSTPYLLLIPAGALLALFSVLPFVWAFLISVQPGGAANTGAISGFTMDNFSNVIDDPRTRESLRVTLIYATLTTFLCVSFSILTALALKTVWRGAGIYQTALLIPLTLAPPVVIILWRAIFSRTSGAANGVLDRVGVPAQGFYESTDQALYVLIAMAVWSNVGFWTLVYLSALNQISTEVFEAADLDGCGPVRKLFYVTLPLLKRTTLLASVVLSSAALVVFVPAQLLTQGGPGGATNFLMYVAAQDVLRFGRPGTANALVVMLLIIIAAAVAIQFRVLRSKDA
jgi:multiple sugar transport system permease protein